MALSSLRVYPATPKRWRDLEKLFGPRGASAGCWCMWWRVKRANFVNRLRRYESGQFGAIRAPGVLSTAIFPATSQSAAPLAF